MEKPTNHKPAKLCYEHIGGKLGNLLLQQFVESGWLAKEDPKDKNFYITTKGITELTRMGLDLSQIKEGHN